MNLTSAVLPIEFYFISRPFFLSVNIEQIVKYSQIFAVQHGTRVMFILYFST